MRSIRGVGGSLVTTSAFITRMTHSSALKSRNDVLARWNAQATTAEASSTAAEAAPKASSGKGMSFASGIFGSLGATSTRLSQENSTVADVKWDLCERMDYYVQYAIPATWSVVEAVRENSVSIQSSPPPVPASKDKGQKHETERPSVHGISINCFAYKQRVAHPDSGKLLHIFLKRFNASVGNSLQILSEYVGKASSLERQPSEHGVGGEMGNESISEMLATRLNSAVAEVTFTPGFDQPLAHGICRAFFNSNARFHYVVVVAVPDGEYAESKDLIVHTLMSVVESRVEAAAKRT